MRHYLVFRKKLTEEISKPQTKNKGMWFSVLGGLLVIVSGVILKGDMHVFMRLALVYTGLASVLAGVAEVFPGLPAHMVYRLRSSSLYMISLALVMLFILGFSCVIDRF